MLLPHDLLKELRTVFSGEDAVAHRSKKLGSAKRKVEVWK
jgi:hypothetical protein